MGKAAVLCVVNAGQCGWRRRCSNHGRSNSSQVGGVEWWRGNGSHPQVVVVVVVIVAGGGEWSWMVIMRCGYGG